MAELSKEDKEKLQQELFKKGLEFESVWKKEVPVYTGRYKSSITTKKKDDGVGVIVGTNVDYAKVLEYGGDPSNFPPVNELRKWVSRSLAVEDDEVDKVAYLIGRKIKEEGIEKQAPMRTAKKKFESNNF